MRVFTYIYIDKCFYTTYVYVTICVCACSGVHYEYVRVFTGLVFIRIHLRVVNICSCVYICILYKYIPT